MEALNTKLTKLLTKLDTLTVKHELLVQEEFATDEALTDLRVKGVEKGTSKLENQLDRILNKCYENTEKQEEVKRQIKNLKAKIKRDAKKIEEKKEVATIEEPKECKEFNFEVYTVHPVTKEGGWDIVYASIIATSKDEAKEILKNWDLFDCIILYNFGCEIKKCCNEGYILNKYTIGKYKEIYSRKTWHDTKHEYRLIKSV